MQYFGSFSASSFFSSGSVAQFMRNRRIILEDEAIGPFVSARDLEAKPGDILQFKRSRPNSFDYSHYGMCYGRDHEGNLEVVHVSGDVNAGVIEAYCLIQNLAEVAGTDLVRVNNLVEPAKREGITEKMDMNAIRITVGPLLGKRVFYNLVLRNCEHYVTEWKYGRAFSQQVTETTSYWTNWFAGPYAIKKEVGNWFCRWRQDPVEVQQTVTDPRIVNPNNIRGYVQTTTAVATWPLFDFKTLVIIASLVILILQIIIICNQRY